MSGHISENKRRRHRCHGKQALQAKMARGVVVHVQPQPTATVTNGWESSAHGTPHKTTHPHACLTSVSLRDASASAPAPAPPATLC